MSSGMSIPGIGSGPSIPPTVTTPGRTSPPARGEANGKGSIAGSAEISRRGHFMHTVQQLAKSDPDRARAMVTELAAKFRDQAKQGGAESGQRQALAERLQQAADTGDYSLLEPPSAGGERGGSPAARAYGTAMAVTRSSR